MFGDDFHENELFPEIEIFGHKKESTGANEDLEQADKINSNFYDYLTKMPTNPEDMVKKFNKINGEDIYLMAMMKI